MSLSYQLEFSVHFVFINLSELCTDATCYVSLSLWTLSVSPLFSSLSISYKCPWQTLQAYHWLKYIHLICIVVSLNGLYTIVNLEPTWVETMFVVRKVRYSALFTNLVGWHAGAVSFPLSNVILAQLACPLSDVKFCLHSGITNLSLYKHWMEHFKVE